MHAGRKSLRPERLKTEGMLRKCSLEEIYIASTTRERPEGEACISCRRRMLPKLIRFICLLQPRRMRGPHTRKCRIVYPTSVNVGRP